MVAVAAKQYWKNLWSRLERWWPRRMFCSLNNVRNGKMSIRRSVLGGGVEGFECAVAVAVVVEGVLEEPGGGSRRLCDSEY